MVSHFTELLGSGKPKYVMALTVCLAVKVFVRPFHGNVHAKEGSLD